MTAELDEADRKELVEQIEVAIALGGEDFDAVVEAAVDHLSATTADVVRDVAIEIAEAEFEAFRSWQRGRDERLDSDRLLRAFRELDMAGIVARADFACCLSCGTAEIGGDLPEDTVARGFAFCHRQDVERAVHAEGLTIAYGRFGAAGDVADIGNEVVAALARHGLTAEWDGDPATRIEVPMSWRRWRVGRMAGPGGGQADDAPLLMSYCDFIRDRQEPEDVPVSLLEGLGTFLELVPGDDNFVIYEGRSGGVIQAMWQKGPRLWLETLDREAQCSHGRLVTLDEAEEVIGVLAREDRVALDLLGETETVPWSAR